MSLPITSEAVFTGAGFMDVPASPLQIAILRAASGEAFDDVLDSEACERHFGCQEWRAVRPRRMVLICGVRGGKSTLLVAEAITSSLTADLAALKPHEVPRFAIIGPTVDAAENTFKQLVGYIQGSKVLRTFMDGEATANTVTLRRPDGRRVEIVVVAAHRGGLSVRGRWLTGICLEECASFGSEASGAAVNAEDILSAAETRLLPGCQAWLISSPFGPTGLLFDMYTRHFGRPGSTLVVHAPTRALNPSFPQERIDEIRAENPDNAAREYDATWVDADSAFLAATLVDRAMRKAPMVRPGRAFAAAMDPATRSNGWTLAVGWSDTPPVKPVYFGEEQPEPESARVTIAGVWQWRGSKQAPLSPRATLREIAGTLRPFGVQTIYSDGWSLDALQDHARAVGLNLVQHTGDRDAPYVKLRTLLANELIELPPDLVMRQDLLSIRQRATANGVKIFLPKTSDGRHADYAPAVALAAHYAMPGSQGGFCRYVYIPGI